MSKTDRELATEIVLEWLRTVPEYKHSNGGSKYAIPSPVDVANYILTVEKQLAKGEIIQKSKPESSKSE